MIDSDAHPDVAEAPSMKTGWTGDGWRYPEIFKKWQSDDNFKFPFFLQPPKVYVGPAWYPRDFEWPGGPALLHLGRVHWQSTVWLDGKMIGSANSPGHTPEFDLGDLSAGKRTITLRIDNRQAPVTATLTGSSPSGNVQFFSGNTLLGTSALNGSFQATFTTNQLAIGPHDITARYVGNSSNGSSNSAAIAIHISPAAPTAPTGLNATPGAANTSNISLSWTAAAGASGYCLKRSSTNGGPKSRPGSFTSSSLRIAWQTHRSFLIRVAASANPGIASIPNTC